jgi:uncharacterized protein YegJ (DUF2314 family)
MRVEPMPSARRHASRCFAIMLVAVSLTMSCEEHAPTPPSDSGTAAGVQPSLWHRIDDRYLVAVPDEASDEALAAATAEARRTADEARETWQVTPPARRDHWAIKWAAPTEDEGVEQVWVQPLHWSPFRIEGRLVSEPRAALVCGKRGGDLVSFPADELTDWIHLPTGDWNGPREGGFTVKVLEERYGKP